MSLCLENELFVEFLCKQSFRKRSVSFVHVKISHRLRPSRNIIGDIPDAGTITGGVMIHLGVALFNNRGRLGSYLQPSMARRST